MLIFLLRKGTKTAHKYGWCQWKTGWCVCVLKWKQCGNFPQACLLFYHYLDLYQWLDIAVQEIIDNSSNLNNWSGVDKNVVKSAATSRDDYIGV